MFWPKIAGEGGGGVKIGKPGGTHPPRIPWGILPALVPVIHLQYINHKDESTIHAGQEKEIQPFLIKSEPGQTVDSN